MPPERFVARTDLTNVEEDKQSRKPTYRPSAITSMAKKEKKNGARGFASRARPLGSSGRAQHKVGLHSRHFEALVCSRPARSVLTIG